MKKLWFSLVAVLLLAACRKPDLPGSIDDTPEFMVTFSHNDTIPKTITAGLDDLYLFTSHDRDALNVVTMRGAFAKSDCPTVDCPGTLTFEFRNFHTGSVLDLDSLPSGLYDFKQADGVPTLVQRTSYYIDYVAMPGDDYFWTLRQSGVLVAESNNQFLQHDFTSTNPVEISFGLHRANGYSSETKESYFFNQPPCPHVAISAKVDSVFFPFHRLEAIVSPSSGNLNYLWSTGDTTSFILVDSVQQGNTYALQVSSDNGCTASVLVGNVDAGNGLVNVSPLIGVNQQDSLIAFDPLQLGRVAIQWVRPSDHRIFRSDEGLQPATAFFRVLESRAYEPNENGEKTNWLRVEFDCLLYDTADGGLDPTLFKGHGVIAVAYP